MLQSPSKYRTQEKSNKTSSMRNAGGLENFEMRSRRPGTISTRNDQYWFGHRCYLKRWAQYRDYQVQPLTSRNEIIIAMEEHLSNNREQIESPCHCYCKHLILYRKSFFYHRYHSPQNYKPIARGGSRRIQSLRSPTGYFANCIIRVKQI